MNACWVLLFKLVYFWRNMNISSIFYFSKSTSINTQYSSQRDTLKMMLFTKYLIKWKCIIRIRWKFLYWFHLKSSMELDTKRQIVYLSNAPLNHGCLVTCPAKEKMKFKVQKNLLLYSTYFEYENLKMTVISGNR